MPEFFTNVVDSVVTYWFSLPGTVQYLGTTLFKILILTVGCCAACDDETAPDQ